MCPTSDLLESSCRKLFHLNATVTRARFCFAWCMWITPSRTVPETGYINRYLFLLLFSHVKNHYLMELQKFGLQRNDTTWTESPCEQWCSSGYLGEKKDGAKTRRQEGSKEPSERGIIHHQWTTTQCSWEQSNQFLMNYDNYYYLDYKHNIGPTIPDNLGSCLWQSTVMMPTEDLQEQNKHTGAHLMCSFSFKGFVPQQFPKRWIL